MNRNAATWLPGSALRAALLLALSACVGGDEVESSASVAADTDRAQAAAAGTANALSVGSTAVGSIQLVSTTTGGAAATVESGLYLKDLTTGTLSLVLSNVDGGSDAVRSGDARKVAFTRLYSGYDRRVFVRDRSTGVETLASASAGGAASTGNSTGQLISRDGTRVVFGSNARNLVSPRPAANVYQVYAKIVAAPAAAPQ